MGNMIDSKGICDALRNQRTVGDMVGRNESHLSTTLMKVAGITAAVGIVGFGACSVISGCINLKNQEANRPVESSEEYNRRLAEEAVRGNKKPFFHKNRRKG